RSRAAFAAGPSTPRRSKDAQSHVTITPGCPGKRSGGTSRSNPGRNPDQRGRRCGWFGYAQVTVAPRAVRCCASPSIDPSASASGWRWRATAPASASRSTPAARSRSSGVTHVLLRVELPDDAVDPLRGLGRDVLLEPELRNDLQSDLTAELVAEVGCRRPERGAGGGAGSVVAERGEGDPGGL